MRLEHNPFSAEMLVACVLVEIDRQNKKVVLIQPEPSEGRHTLSIDEIKEYYTGYAIFIRSSYRFDSRTDEVYRERPQSWFWGVIVLTWKIYAEVILASFFINIFGVASSLFVMNVYDRVVPINPK